MTCKNRHQNIQREMENIPIDQGGRGRHKCAACAYERGFEDGLNLTERIDLANILNNLDYSQAQAQRHRSPHAAYAKGYFDGVQEHYRRE